jgi:hypothetical protein
MLEPHITSPPAPLQPTEPRKKPRPWWLKSLVWATVPWLVVVGGVVLYFCPRSCWPEVPIAAALSGGCLLFFIWLLLSANDRSSPGDV